MIKILTNAIAKEVQATIKCIPSHKSCTKECLLFPGEMLPGIPGNFPPPTFWGRFRTPKSAKISAKKSAKKSVFALKSAFKSALKSAIKSVALKKVLVKVLKKVLKRVLHSKKC